VKFSADNALEETVLMKKALEENKKVFQDKLKQWLADLESKELQ
jgi:hypothetical protein